MDQTMLSETILNRHIVTEPQDLPINKSGMIPFGMRVLVLPDPVEETTAGGIIIPKTAQEREEHAVDRGLLVAAGRTAWSEDAKLGDIPPRPGQRVAFAKYGGRIVKGDDGQNYRIMNDEDLVALLED